MAEIGQENPKINNLVSRIELGEVKIPPLQRPFVWNNEQIIDLLESVYNDYPIGSILWWETSEKLPSQRNIAGFELPDRPEKHPIYYVLDGQQRLSSLYGVFCTDRTIDPKVDEEYKIDSNIFDISFDLSQRNFIHKSQEESHKKYFELKKLFKMPEFLAANKDATEEEQKTIQDLYEKFSNYEIPIIITKKREREEVGVIFERVNNTGTKLDLFDLMAALTWKKDFHLRDEFKKIHNCLEKKNFKGIKDKVILQCLSGITKESSKLKIITSLKGQEVRDNIDLLEESLKKTIDYLSTELSVKSARLLPHAHQIVPLCYFFSKVNAPTASQKNVLNKWFWKTSFSDRFTASTDRRIDEDISGFKKLIDENDSKVSEKLKHSVTPEQLIDTKFRRSNALSRAFVVLLASKGPKDLTSGTTVDTGEALSYFNRREYHHIFPKKYLEREDVSNEKIESLCSFCILPSGSNKIISHKKPSDYFSNIIPKQDFENILDSNIIPTDKSIYNDNDFDQFLDTRSKMIIEYLDNLIGS